MRSIFWKHRLKYVSAVLLCLGITFAIYYHLPGSTTLPIGVKNSLHIDHLPINLKSSLAALQSDTSHNLTLFIREYEDFENTLSETVYGIRKTLGDNASFVIVADSLPYPPIDLSHCKCASILTLSSDLSKNCSSTTCLLQFVKTNFVLFIPDGIKITSWDEIMRATVYLASNVNVKAIAIPVENKTLDCSSLEITIKEWTISFLKHQINNGDHCSYVEGIHALLMTKETLMSLPEPFARPFPFTFYVQAAVKNWNIHILKDSKFTMFHQFFKEFHLRWKHKQAQMERLVQFYKKVGIKREILKSGVSNYYGCTKKTVRCFGTVIHDMPRYLYEGRWTPPCCLQALRESIAHVFGILDKCKARYWLEGGSLLGAARHGDIIPWDYDVDVGIYLEDVDKCHHLRQAKVSPYIDEEEYVWETAREGEFYRVQYSETNHLHVDIFPFYSKNGIMTKNTWFETHPQDTEFPESFLIPLTRIKFAGIEANAPNNVRKFLELKFGKNVIENPKYPNLQPPVS